MTDFKLVIVVFAVAAAATVQAQPAQIDSLLASDMVAAETMVDSLRMQIRNLDREIQSMKQNWANGGDVDRLIAALAAGDAEIDLTNDTRSRRQRVDTLLRAITQRPGQLRFNGSATTVVQDLVAGEATDAASSGSLDLYAHSSFGPGTLLFFAFEAGSGAGIDAFLPLITPLNGDAAPTRGPEGFDQLALSEAWAEFTALGEAVTLTAGKIDLTNYFDINLVANDETAQFVSGAFVNSAAFLAPDAGPGLRARTVLFRRYSIQMSVTSADSTGGSRFQDAFTMGSIGVRLFPDTDLDGNLRAYIYDPPHEGRDKGWGVSLDQSLGGATAVFGRWGRNDHALAAEGGVREAWSAGLQWTGSLRGRRFIAGGAWGRTSADSTDRERNLELYTSWQINTWTFISPHLQVVRNTGRMAQKAVAVGLRVQFNF